MAPLKVTLIISSIVAFSVACSSAQSETPKLLFTPGGSTTSEGTSTYIQPSSLVKVLKSKLANPNQSSLDRILTKIDRVRIFAGGESNGKPLSKQILLDSRNPQVLTELKQSLRIEDEPEELGHDMCYGDPTIELLAGNKRLAVLGFHHARAIRWDKNWKFDGNLKDGRQLVDWFFANGITGPKLALDNELKERRRSSADLQKWTMATPDCLRPYLPQMLVPAMTNVLVFLPEPRPTDALKTADPSLATMTPRQKQLMSVLDTSYNDQHDKVLALLQWYASGIGSWTGFPTYEELPAELLLAIPTEAIIAGLNAKDVSEPELEGAARYFASHIFRATKPQDLALIDAKLKQRLLQHCLKSDDDDKRKRAEHAFGVAESLESADNRGH